MGDIGKRLKKFWEYGEGRMALAAFCAHSVSISIGICQGYSAILIPQLDSSKEIKINSEESSWLASLGAITNPAGSILSGFLAEYYGRKRSIQISSVPFIVGWLCLGFAESIDMLYVGRLISGIAAGMSSASYTYVSEISTPEKRGALQSLGPICASFGILLTYVLGYFIRWSLVAFISIAFGIFTLIAIYFMPESPAYLMKKGENNKCFDSYVWLRRNNVEAQQEIERHTAAKKELPEEGTSTKEDYLSPQTVKPFLILVTLFFLQEMSGIYTILFYAVNFFHQTGVGIDDYISSIIIGAIRFVMSIVAGFLLNKFGRKILCIISSAGMAVTLLPMVVFFKYYEIHTNETRVFKILPLICVIFNVFFSMIGMLPIPWVLVGELFPLKVRSIMCGFVICLAQSFIFLVVKIYPDMIDSWNFSGTLLSFLIASLVAAFFSKFVLPETKNKSLQEIEEFFRGGKNESEEIEGYDNAGFVLRPEKLNNGEKSSDIFTVKMS